MIWNKRSNRRPVTATTSASIFRKRGGATALVAGYYSDGSSSTSSMPGLMPVTCLSSGSMPLSPLLLAEEEEEMTFSASDESRHDVCAGGKSKQSSHATAPRIPDSKTATGMDGSSISKLFFLFVHKHQSLLFLSAATAFFWSSRVLIWYGSYHILQQMHNHVAKWLVFYRQDLRPLTRTLQAAYQRFQQETRKTVSGSYSRQVAAAYMLTMCTAPGESYVAKVIRYKMSMLNLDFMDELEHRWKAVGVKRRFNSTVARGR